jgi:hypothetical protein
LVLVSTSWPWHFYTQKKFVNENNVLGLGLGLGLFFVDYLLNNLTKE